MQGHSTTAQYPDGFKNKRKSQEVSQSLSEKENLEEPGKRAKDGNLCFTLLLSGHIKHELSVYDESYGNIINGHRRGNFRVKKYLKE